MITQPLRIGTRASKLALAQSGLIRDRIAKALPTGMVSLAQITTSGDRIQDRTLTEIGGKGLFTKEIEDALLSGRIDCAVHSLKDMPALSPPGLVIAAIPEREDPRDAFLSVAYDSIEALPRGARLGTASLRRQTQARHRRPDLVIVPLRGNVDTRLAKLERGDADAILVAMAGLNRLGLGHLARGCIDPLVSPPAPGQGALAIQTREADADAPWLDGLKHRPTTLAVAAERAALAVLEGSCRTAIGAFARVEGGRLILIVEALTPDGARCFRREGEVEVGDQGGEAAARQLGMRLGGEVSAEGGEALLG
ncbi:MAG: porphobilinogen deaminase [Caulobacteraceae bacterium]|jgi:hydroxymethylbilane synthase|nr:porphobilinogen deaminase [Caulobacteraceae bacterium]